jgi:hypothetical protein
MEYVPAAHSAQTFTPPDDEETYEPGAQFTVGPESGVAPTFNVFPLTAFDIVFTAEIKYA